MIPQIKYAIVVFALLLPGSTVWGIQPDSLIVRGQVDSMILELERSFDHRIQDHQDEMKQMLLLFQQESDRQQEIIDTLRGGIDSLEAFVALMRVENQEMKQQLTATEEKTITNKYILDREKERVRRIFYITAPSLFGLILLSTLLYYFLMARHAEQTERKLMALRKYTHYEAEEIRYVLWQKFKKRLKKLRDKDQKKSAKKKRKKK